MTLNQLVIREISHRKRNFSMGLVSVAIAAGCLIGALVLLDAHDTATREILSEKEAALEKRMAEFNKDMGKSMLKLGFNLVIIPKDQNLGDWYANDYASKYMPESYVKKLADSGIITVRHFLPSLQQKVRWPEKKRTIILVGTRGEVPNLHLNPKKPLGQPVAPGNIVLGFELHDSLHLKPGDTTPLLGKEFTVSKCYPERGNKDDITAWIDLEQAQTLLDKQGKINAILALQCNCPNSEIAKIRAEISNILPEVRVIEKASKVVARAEARERVRNEAHTSIENEKNGREILRREREHFSAILVPIVIIACAVWISFLAFSNVRERRSEIAVLRTLGVHSGQIFFVFLSRAAIMGITGGAAGLLAGAAMTRRFNTDIDTNMIVIALVMAPLLSMMAGWIPALLAAQQDPADILRDE